MIEYTVTCKACGKTIKVNAENYAHLDQQLRKMIWAVLTQGKGYYCPGCQDKAPLNESYYVMPQMTSGHTTDKDGNLIPFEVVPTVKAEDVIEWAE